jgi:outer membrane protein
MVKNGFKGIGIICLMVISFFIYHSYFTARTGYVDIPKVFNGFDMKKEFQEKYKKTEALRKRMIDSLSLDLQLLSRKLKNNQKDKDLMSEFDVKRDDFFKRRKQVEEDNAALSEQYDKQILEQMSQYILDFGKKNNYDVILGTEGNGSIMYANEKYDISEKVKKYINERYKGVE